MTRAVRPRPDPVISVVMPVYNGAALLPATLDSLAAQSFTDFEVIVVDDCSRDKTASIVAANPAVTLLRMERNGGKGRAVRAGIAPYTDESDVDRLLEAVGELATRDRPACP